MHTREDSLYQKRRGGFTLAELLIVVAIIAVLVAIAIPVFTKQLERSREATDLSNIRSAYAEAVADCLASGGEWGFAAVMRIHQREAGWLIESGSPVLHTRVNGVEQNVPLPNNLVYGDAAIVVVVPSGFAEVTRYEGQGETDSGTSGGSAPSGGSSGTGTSGTGTSGTGTSGTGSGGSGSETQDLNAPPGVDLSYAARNDNFIFAVTSTGVPIVMTSYAGGGARASEDKIYIREGEYYKAGADSWLHWNPDTQNWDSYTNP